MGSPPNRLSDDLFAARSIDPDTDIAVKQYEKALQLRLTRLRASLQSVREWRWDAAYMHRVSLCLCPAKAGH